MGLSSFNRARRSRLPVEEYEAERFQKDNAARWGAHHALDTDKKQIARELEKGRKLEAAAVEEIGEKMKEGVRLGETGGITDLPLRQDHAAEIAGRVVEDPQGPPKDPIQHLRDRIPSGTANEELVKHTQVDQPGPSAELVKAATLEITPAADRDAKERQIDADNKAAEGEKARIDEEKAVRQEKAALADNVAEPAPAPAPSPAQLASEAKAEKDAKEATLPAAGKSAGADTEAPTSSATPAKDEKKTTPASAKK